LTEELDLISTLDSSSYLEIGVDYFNEETFLMNDFGVLEFGSLFLRVPKALLVFVSSLSLLASLVIEANCSELLLAEEVN
jgi:hypothetical protein